MIGNRQISEGGYEYSYLALCDSCGTSSITIFSHVPLTYQQLTSVVVSSGWIDDNEFDEWRCWLCDKKNYWIDERWNTILRF